MPQHIYLTGFMGSGKTTVGRLLAQHLHLPFFDLDCVIEKKMGQSVKEIFSQKGEAYFRGIESEVLRKLSAHPRSVISLGGGTPLLFANRKILEKGIWINLQVPEAWLFKRLSATTNRPLLGGVVDRQVLGAILQKRRPVYGLAPVQFYDKGYAPICVAQFLYFYISFLKL